VTIPHTDVVVGGISCGGDSSGGRCCPKLQKILYLLGTYYNLFVLIDMMPPDAASSDADNTDEKKKPSSSLFGGGGGDNEQEVRNMREYIQQIRSILLDQGNNDRGIDSSFSSNHYQLNSQILPHHRIAFASTPQGRIAFVRQLASGNNNNSPSSSKKQSEFIIDHDASVKTELERFGFRVLIYPKATTTTTTTASTATTSTSSTITSALGKFLIP
jgi:hypothetical protein